MLDTENYFHVGSTVIHWAYGMGVIIQLDEKELFGDTRQYYVVQINDLTIWVPATDNGECSLRLPTPAKDFNKLFKLLASPGEPLPDDRLERKTLLSGRLKDGKLETICRVIRDLTLHRRSKKMNDHDSSTLERAKNFLLNEWSTALSIPLPQAGQQLRELLDIDKTPLKKG
jgi:CarD family transcriptional regulator